MTQPNTYIMRCTACGTRNRIPVEKVGTVAKCGKCQGPVHTDVLRIDHALTITDSDFDSQILRSPLPALLDCWAPWCGPCQMMEPFMTELAATWQGRIRVGKMNVDENPRTSSQYRIMSIPTLLIFDNGQLKDTLTGALPRQSIVQAMSAYL
ncbi:thioredoxin TrxC [Desulfonema ishimotonii]|uniref:Thioredoxin n=1 Tax=Desulfonema ishimotonii TaxID=45657 RepID=A0A401FVB2_9BACT|nr:thioredoxin [Desulfonema ishimotonii]GBC60884.1 thioredoxin TrxC [Desulfonema ishimotonii]